MRLLIVGLAVLAVVVAGLSTYLINTFYSKAQLQELEQLARPKVTRVLIAAREIRPGDALSPANVVWQAWGSDSVSPSFASVIEPTDSTAESSKRLETYLGQIARRGFVVGEPIVTGKIFKPKDAAFMSGILGNGMRAIAIAVKPEHAAGGFVLPGDYVDVLLTHKLAGDLEKEKRRGSGRGGGSIQNLSVVTFTTETIVSGVRVVAIDQSHDKPGEKAVASKSVTLEVTPKQAELITTGEAMGKLSIVLRSIDAKTETGQAGFTTDVETSPLLSKMTGGRKAAASAEPKQNTEGAPGRVIRIYRGGESTTQEISVK